jgi:hypothetical protein
MEVKHLDKLRHGGSSASIVFDAKTGQFHSDLPRHTLREWWALQAEQDNMTALSEVRLVPHVRSRRSPLAERIVLM